MINSEYSDINQEIANIKEQSDALSKRSRELCGKRVSIINSLEKFFKEKYKMYSCSICVYKDSIEVDFGYEQGHITKKIRLFYPKTSYILYDGVFYRDDVIMVEDMLVEIKTKLMLEGILKP